jgi:hypothetical protein
MEENNWYSKNYKEKNKKLFEIKESKENLDFDAKVFWIDSKKNENKQINSIIKDIEKNINPKINKKLISWISSIIVIIIIAFLYFSSQLNSISSYKPLDIIIHNESSLPIDIYYNNKNLMIFSGWETQLEYNGKKDRIFGDEDYKNFIFDDNGRAYTFISLGSEILLEPLKSNPDKIKSIGWFNKQEQISIAEEKSSVGKIEKLKLSNGKLSIKNADLNFYVYKNKPYFKVEFNAEAENESALGELSYGFILNSYDIHLEDGSILKNDNKILETNKTPEIILIENNTSKNISQDLIDSLSKQIDLNKNYVNRNGSYQEVKNTDYEIFYNQNLKRIIIVYSPFANNFKSSFYWNVFWINLAYLGEDFSPVYFMIIDNADLSYDTVNKEWRIESPKYSGSSITYMDKTVYEIENT